MEVLRRCPLAIAQRLVHCAIALSTAVPDRVTKTMSVAPLLMNSLDNSKQKTSNLLSPAPPPYSWSLLGKSEGPAPPPSSKISWSFDLAWNPAYAQLVTVTVVVVGLVVGLLRTILIVYYFCSGLLMPAFPLRGTADVETEVPSVENQSWHLFCLYFYYVYVLR